MPALSARTRANRLNAQKSTGPSTSEGKAASSRNATKHGLFCKDLLLEGEDASEFDAMKEGLLRRLNPRDAMELRVCDQIIAAHWKLLRIRSAEQEAYADEAQVMHNELIQFRSARQPKSSLECPLPRPEAGMMLYRMFNDLKDPAIERLSKYELRISHVLQRCMKELRTLQEQPLIGQLSEVADEALREETPVPADAQADAASGAQNEANDDSAAANRRIDQQMYRALRDYRRNSDLQKEMFKAMLNAPLPTLKPAQTVDELLAETLAAMPEPAEPEATPKTAA